MLKPILDRVLIRRIEEEKDGKIVIPEQYRQQSNKGEVVAIGDFVIMGGQKILLSTIINVGDKVLFGEYNTEKVEADGEQLELVRVQDIRGVERHVETRARAARNLS